MAVEALFNVNGLPASKPGRERSDVVACQLNSEDVRLGRQLEEVPRNRKLERLQPGDQQAHQTAGKVRRDGRG
eukprot:3813266-Prymnesium_polylepis.1